MTDSKERQARIDGLIDELATLAAQAIAIRRARVAAAAGAIATLAAAIRIATVSASIPTTQADEGGK